MTKKLSFTPGKPGSDACKGCIDPKEDVERLERDLTLLTARMNHMSQMAALPAPAPVHSRWREPHGLQAGASITLENPIDGCAEHTTLAPRTPDQDPQAITTSPKSAAKHPQTLRKRERKIQHKTHPRKSQLLRSNSPIHMALRGAQLQTRIL